MSFSPPALGNPRRRIVRLNTAWIATGKTPRCVLSQFRRGRIVGRVCGWLSLLYETEIGEIPCLSNRSSPDLHTHRDSTTSRSMHLSLTYRTPASSECNA